MSTPARWAIAFRPRRPDFVEDAVAGSKVRLDRDISDRDHYDRLLRYVFVDGTLVEEELVRQGLAEAVEYPPDTKYAAALESAQAEAKAAHRGIWGDSCDIDTATTPARHLRLTTATPRTRACAYPPRHPTWTAVTWTPRTSRSCRPIHTGSTATATGSAARRSSARKSDWRGDPLR